MNSDNIKQKLREITDAMYDIRNNITDESYQKILNNTMDIHNMVNNEDEEQKQEVIEKQGQYENDEKNSRYYELPYDRINVHNKIGDAIETGDVRYMAFFIINYVNIRKRSGTLLKEYYDSKICKIFKKACELGEEELAEYCCAIAIVNECVKIYLNKKVMYSECFDKELYGLLKFLIENCVTVDEKCFLKVKDVKKVIDIYLDSKKFMYVEDCMMLYNVAKNIDEMKYIKNHTNFTNNSIIKYIYLIEDYRTIEKVVDLYQIDIGTNYLDYDSVFLYNYHNNKITYEAFSYNINKGMINMMDKYCPELLNTYSDKFYENNKHNKNKKGCIKKIKPYLSKENLSELDACIIQ